MDLPVGRIGSAAPYKGRVKKDKIVCAVFLSGKTAGFMQTPAYLKPVSGNAEINFFHTKKPFYAIMLLAVSRFLFMERGLYTGNVKAT